MDRRPRPTSGPVDRRAANGPGRPTGVPKPAGDSSILGNFGRATRNKNRQVRRPVIGPGACPETRTAESNRGHDFAVVRGREEGRGFEALSVDCGPATEGLESTTDFAEAAAARGSRVLVIGRNRTSCGWLLPLLLISGCFQSSDGRLLGRWEGTCQPAETAVKPRDDVPANSSVTDTLPHLRELRVLLTCEPRHFEMTLSRPDGSNDRRDGSWKVLETRGSRWLVEFVSDASPDRVRLQIVFDDDDRFTAREVQGDDRLGAIQFRRMGVSREN